MTASFPQFIWNYIHIGLIVVGWSNAHMVIIKLQLLHMFVIDNSYTVFELEIKPSSTLSGVCMN